MAKPPPHLRITASGTLGSPAAEIWSCSFHAGPVADVNQGPGAAQVVTPGGTTRDNLVAAVRGLWGQAGLCSNLVVLTQVLIAAIDENGAVKRRADGAYDQVKVPITGKSGASTATPAVPPQVALVGTLQSTVAGAYGRGRVFIPMPGFPMAGDLRISAGDAGAAADALQVTINAMNQAFSAGDQVAPDQRGYRVCVASGGSVKHSVPPGLRRVTSVRVGRVLDTMRTRRNALDEAYVSRALAA